MVWANGWPVNCNGGLSGGRMAEAEAEERLEMSLVNMPGRSGWDVMARDWIQPG